MHATTPIRDAAEHEDALKVLRRIADAFDYPSSPEIHKGLRLIVHAIETHRPRTSYSSQESQSQHARFARCDSTFDISYDADVELVGLRGAAIEEQIASYASDETLTRHSGCYEDSRSPSERTLQQDDVLHDITKMLLASSPLDRLNYLARTELKNTGWFERTCVFPFIPMFRSCT
ncbi:hypothetical protein PAXRUDRAFT_154551 [Paxillus rubicundulus Ve08.2h10]|uniref:Uncharacterized protein n=1 Tax=Paxillus rubicundulus Ve08.2h10 TaxID=930991 RepID=A0A0D0CHB0_9AGAM|nr:hypothetical protein PAXRUDRAFT_154551 [Paxillus rubicundulus Ve08.2h10]